MSLKIGDTCPSFSLKDQFGTTVNSDTFLKKKPLVIFFYPKDNTPGCTKEACSFRDSHEIFKDLNCEVIGISSDSVNQHLQFAEQNRLTFTLLSDSQKTVRKAFGVPNNLFGLIPGRVTYIINKEGIVCGIFNSQTDPLGHIEKALEMVKKL